MGEWAEHLDPGTMVIVILAHILSEMTWTLPISKLQFRGTMTVLANVKPETTETIFRLVPATRSRTDLSVPAATPRINSMRECRLWRYTCRGIGQAPTSLLAPYLKYLWSEDNGNDICCDRLGSSFSIDSNQFRLEAIILVPGAFRAFQQTHHYQATLLQSATRWWRRRIIHSLAFFWVSWTRLSHEVTILP